MCMWPVSTLRTASFPAAFPLQAGRRSAGSDTTSSFTLTHRAQSGTTTLLPAGRLFQMMRCLSGTRHSCCSAVFWATGGATGVRWQQGIKLMTTSSYSKWKVSEWFRFKQHTHPLIPQQQFKFITECLSSPSLSFLSLLLFISYSCVNPDTGDSFHQ